MSVHAALNHRTSYIYDRRVGMGPQIVRLRPAPHARTRILSYALQVEPKTHFINWQQDPFGNWQARLVFLEKTERFSVTVDLVADMTAINPFDFFLEDSAYAAPFTYEEGLARELAPYLEAVPGCGAAFDELAREGAALLDRPDEYRTVDFFVDVNQLVHRRIAYTVRMEPGVQTPEETIEKALGSCRDSGWLLVALLRRLGYAARFISGYLIQLTPDEKPIDGGPAGPVEDFTDLHAWCEVYAPGAGWVGLDPTSGLFAGEGHIPLAATPRPSSAAPISGGHEPAEVSFDFAMSVTRLRQSPRVTAPVSDDDWKALLKVGDAVDARLAAGDVRLTMGGEPTFIAAFDRDADEWNTAAVGPTKRAYADRLIRRLRDRFAPGGLLQHGQGKWYPGEQLPRWAFALIWRADGEPLWGDADLVAREDGPRGADVHDAARFAQGLAESLGVAPEAAQPAFEDPAEFMLHERKLAPNLDPIDNKLDDPMERDRLARVFDRGFETPASYVLPIQAQQAAADAPQQRQLARARRFRWRTEPWRTRRGRLFLIPGDSPAGFRLPLRALAHIDDADYPHVNPFDPMAPRRRLRRRSQVLSQRAIEQRLLRDHYSSDIPFSMQTRGSSPSNAGAAWVEPQDDDALLPTEEAFFAGAMWLPMTDVAPGSRLAGGGLAIRTAIAVEPRDGILCVFLPPVGTADEYVDLIEAIEETADRLGLAVHVEGYPPPPDHRLREIKVTPDPGVIEVNIHPAASWAEQVAITEGLYEDARMVGLEASKFMVDGRPTGSGGGAHVVVGGAKPIDSPFLRRPDVLGSLIRFWQNHPSLSYLFSSLFIGPTSQAPRVDEGRHDALYELEIALKQIPTPGGAGECPPWLVDRLLRNLLIDVAGNTHRAEICIDKLYNPDGPTGRLGLVEFRAFEMPPHARMNLAQQLLLRGLIAWFWEQPYERPFQRFGTLLHDKYMLPHYLQADFEDVLLQLSSGLGMLFERRWFDAQIEFRFPRYGAVRHGGVELELRAALEPWHVLGEEGAIGGATRFVDSSVERLQVKATGDLSDRYVVTCNGMRLPMTETARRDERVAGVRFRTWWPASCLHPTIPPHGPLIFDVVDTWSGRALGGCTYHVSHPGGFNYETQPVNALEADGRRQSRFQNFGHTPGLFSVAEPNISPEAPYTLDLRRQ